MACTSSTEFEKLTCNAKFKGLNPSTAGTRREVIDKKVIKKVYNGSNTVVILLGFDPWLKGSNLAAALTGRQKIAKKVIEKDCQSLFKLGT